MMSDEQERLGRHALVCIAFNQVQVIQGRILHREYNHFQDDNLSQRAYHELETMGHKFLNYLAHLLWDLDGPPQPLQDFIDVSPNQDGDEQRATLRCAERLLRRAGYAIEDQFLGLAHLPDHQTSQASRQAEGCVATASMNQAAVVKRRNVCSPAM